MFPYKNAVDIIGKIHVRPADIIILPVLYYTDPLKPKQGVKK